MGDSKEMQKNGAESNADEDQFDIKEFNDESEIPDDTSQEEKQKEKVLLDELGVGNVSAKSMQYLGQKREKKKPHGPSFI